MTGTIIITFCLLILAAYVFDLTASRTKIPSVLLLLGLGWGIRQLAVYLELPIPDVSPMLPILGTVGLILIVLEGALELEYDPTKRQIIGKSFLMGFLLMAFLSLILAYGCTLFGYPDFKQNLLNVIPLCVISSAIAIPSAQGLSHEDKEFVVYESSFSDILGILMFNFLVANEQIQLSSFVEFSFQMVLIIAVSLVATIGLVLLMNKITHHIKYVPIVFSVILIYELSKEYGLPSLIFILIFGLFLGNIEKFQHHRWLRRFDLHALEDERPKFKKQVTEATFLVRSLFFILFGYLIRNDELFDSSTLMWAIAICAIIFVLRAVLLKSLKMKLIPLFSIAPRGLITILLFLSIPQQWVIPFINRSLIIQIIIITALMMMPGLLFDRKRK